jgi:hypothetical protein
MSTFLLKIYYHTTSTHLKILIHRMNLKHGLLMIIIMYIYDLKDRFLRFQAVKGKSDFDFF